MPSRVIRGDDLLESPPFMGLPEECQAFTLKIFLLADDFGLVPLSPSFLGRRAFLNRPGDKKLSSLIERVVAADQLRIYEFEGVKYGFIPRFGQRLKAFRSRCPMPPPELYADDPHAVENFKKYRAQFKKLAPSSGGPTPVSGESRPEVKGSEVKGSQEILKAAPPTTVAQPRPAPPSDDVNGVESDSKRQKLEQRGVVVGIYREQGEHDSTFNARVVMAERGQGHPS